MPRQQELPGADSVERTPRKANRAPAASPSTEEPDSTPRLTPPRLAYLDNDNGVRLFHGNCLHLFDELSAKFPDGLFDMVFADPPYFSLQRRFGPATAVSVGVGG